MGAIASVALIRYLGAANQGVYAYLLSVVTLFGFISDFGLSSILIREMKISGPASQRLLGNAIFVQAVQILTALSLINIYAAFFEPNPEVSSTLVLASFVLTLNYMANPFTSTLASFEKMYFSGLAAGLASFFNAGFIFTSIYLNLSLDGILIMLGASNVLHVVVSCLLCRRFAVKPVFSIEKNTIKKLLKMGFPFATIALFYYVYTKMDVLLLYKIKGALDAGYYSSAMRLIDMLVMVVGSIAAPLFPRLSYVLDKETKAATARVMSLSVKYMAVLTAPFVLMVSALSGDYTRLVLGEEFVKSSPVVAILMWVVLMVSLRIIPGHALNAARHTSLVAYVFGANILISVGLNLAFIPKYGYLATSVINLLCGAVSLAGVSYFASRKIGSPGTHLFLLKALAAMALQTVFICLMKGRMNFLTLSLFSLFVYSAAIVITGYFDREDVSIVRNILRKPLV